MISGCYSERGKGRLTPALPFPLADLLASFRRTIFLSTRSSPSLLFFFDLRRRRRRGESSVSIPGGGRGEGRGRKDSPKLRVRQAVRKLLALCILCHGPSSAFDQSTQTAPRQVGVGAVEVETTAVEEGGERIFFLARRVESDRRGARHREGGWQR